MRIKDIAERAGVSTAAVIVCTARKNITRLCRDAEKNQKSTERDELCP